MMALAPERQKHKATDKGGLEDDEGLEARIYYAPPRPFPHGKRMTSPRVNSQTGDLKAQEYL